MKHVKLRAVVDLEADISEFTELTDCLSNLQVIATLPGWIGQVSSKVCHLEVVEPGASGEEVENYYDPDLPWDGVLEFRTLGVRLVCSDSIPDGQLHFKDRNGRLKAVLVVSHG